MMPPPPKTGNPAMLMMSAMKTSENNRSSSTISTVDTASSSLTAEEQDDHDDDDDATEGSESQHGEDHQQNSNDNNGDDSDNTKHRNVHWDRRVTVVQIPHYRDMPSKQVEELWITASEFDSMKQSARRVLIALIKNKLDSFPDDSARGLEGKTRSGAKLRNENKAIFRNAVLEEQQRQWMDDEDEEADVESLRHIAQSKSLCGVQMAVATAQRDAEDARRIYAEDGDCHVDVSI